MCIENEHLPLQRIIALTSRYDIARANKIKKPIIFSIMIGNKNCCPSSAVFTIAPIAGREIRRGDIIVYASEDTLIAHRLLLPPPPGSRGLCFEKGDNNPSGKWISSRRIIGIVSQVIHGDGTIIDLQSPESRHQAEKAVNRSLRSDIRTRALFIPRKIKYWLLKK